MKKIKKFKILRRQEKVVYVNPKIKAFDILSRIKKKIDRHRVLICIQILMKKGKSEKALKVMHEVVYNLFKDESERRSNLGGIYYIIDGIKRLEQVLFIMPIKKKGRVRYKKAKFLNQQKSISKAVQLLMKHVQQKVFETQQSYANVLTKEFKELYMGISQLYKKNDEVYQEIITLRYRRKYKLLSGIYLAKYRKKRETYMFDRKKNISEKKYQEIRKIKKARKVKKRFQKIKSLDFRAKIEKIGSCVKNHFEVFIKKRHKKYNKKYNVKDAVFWKSVNKCTNKYEILIKLVLKTIDKNLIVFYMYFLLNHIFLPNLKKLIKILMACIKTFLSFLTKESIKFLVERFGSLRNQNMLFTKKEKFKLWSHNNKARQVVTGIFSKDILSYNWHVIYVKNVFYSTMDYYYILMHKYHKHVMCRLKLLKKFLGVYKIEKAVKKLFFKKKRYSMHKRKKRGLKFPNVRLYSKKYLKELIFMKEVKKLFFTKDMKGIIEEISVSLKDMRLKRANVLLTKEG